MKMLEPSQQTFFDGMELPLMSSRAASRAKTLASLENSAAWGKAPDPASGPRLSDLLASYDRATSSWRTSQHCLLAQAKNEADGLAEFSETWPSAGMMRNGKTYQRQPWALPIAESASGSWLTPRASDTGKGENQATFLRRMGDRTAKCFGSLAAQVNAQVTSAGGQAGPLNPTWVEWLMGFPTGWTDLQPSETP
jgi:hypothetical protein